MGWLKKLLSYLWIFVLITLAWDASPTPTVTGYKLYYGYELPTGELDFQSRDVGKVLTYQIDLPAGQHWYFRVTAYDAHGNESEFSNQVDTKPKKPTLNYGW